MPFGALEQRTDDGMWPSVWVGSGHSRRRAAQHEEAPDTVNDRQDGGQELDRRSAAFRGKPGTSQSGKRNAEAHRHADPSAIADVAASHRSARDREHSFTGFRRW